MQVRARARRLPRRRHVRLHRHRQEGAAAPTRRSRRARRQLALLRRPRRRQHEPRLHAGRRARSRWPTRREPPQLGRAELHGDCTSATHFVRSASVGAFVLKTGTAAKIQAAADIFAFTSRGNSTSNEAIINRDGDLAACNATTADDAKAAPACSSLVRLELKAIESGDTTAPPDPFLELITTNACPAGLSEQAGKCARSAPGKPHLCEYGNAQDCRTQCGAGDAPSCTRLGLMHERGEGVPASPTAAISSYQKACDPTASANTPSATTNAPLNANAFAPACGRLGLLMLIQPSAPSPPVAALGYLHQACEAGWMQACQARIEYFRAHPDHMTPNLLATAERGCNGGNGGSCTSLGWLHASGFFTAAPTTAPDAPIQPGPPDYERASHFYRRGCNAGFSLGCTLLAQAYAKGLGVPQDEPRAVEILQLACRTGAMSACSDLSSFYFLGTGGLDQSHEKGIELLARACHKGHTSSCFVLGLRHRKGISVPANEAKALEFFKLACDGGDKTACTQMTKTQSAATLVP